MLQPGFQCARFWPLSLSWKVSCISATYLHDVRNDSFERAFDTEPVDALETDDISEG